MLDFEGKKILLGVCGGIAAYKAVYLARELTQRGASVRVVMTPSASAFIMPMTFQALTGFPVRTALFDAHAEDAMDHIALARWADYVVIAPATADFLAKLAHGFADELLATLVLATSAPVMVCPAMNQYMWSNEATTANCLLLKQRGVMFVGPAAGLQACGDDGFGRMAEVHAIMNALRVQGVRHVLSARRVIITAGPTREPLDPVRYLSNRSSGKMGYALADAAFVAGAEVILISGPTALPPPLGVTMIAVETAAQMHAAVMSRLRDGDIFIGAAAVADYGVENPATDKLKKQHHSSLSLLLQPNPDVLTAVATTKKTAFIVGFAAETSDVLANARQKLEKKRVDMVIANRVGPRLGFDEDEHEVTAITAAEEHALSRQNKWRLAAQLIAIVASCLQNSVRFNSDTEVIS